MSESIDRRASKIGWIFAACLPIGAIAAGIVGLVPIAIGLPASLILFLLFGTTVKRTIACALKLGLAMSVYGRMALGIVVIGLILAGASAPESRLGALIVPVVLSLLVLDRLCGYVGRGELFEEANEKSMQRDVDATFDLLQPLPVTGEMPDPEPTRTVTKVDAPAQKSRVVVPSSPVTPEVPGSFAAWMADAKTEPTGS